MTTLTKKIGKLYPHSRHGRRSLTDSILRQQNKGMEQYNVTREPTFLQELEKLLSLDSEELLHRTLPLPLPRTEVLLKLLLLLLLLRAILLLPSLAFLRQFVFQVLPTLRQPPEEQYRQQEQEQGRFLLLQKPILQSTKLSEISLEKRRNDSRRRRQLYYNNKRKLKRTAG